VRHLRCGVQEAGRLMHRRNVFRRALNREARCGSCAQKRRSHPRRDDRIRRRAPLRLTPEAHDHRNDHRADGAACRPRDNRHDRHAGRLRGRNLGRAGVSSGFQAYSAPDFLHSPLLRVRQHDLRACGEGVRREDSRRGHRAGLRCGRSSDHAYGDGWHDVSRCKP
jgi:hypothetical protein